MPIHVSYRSMLVGFRSQYCKKGVKRTSQKLSNGKRFYMCKSGWSKFFATIKARGWDEKKPMPRKRK